MVRAEGGLSDSAGECENKPIGLWGQRHKCYLKEHRKIVYTQLLTSGRLNSYLVEIDQQVQEKIEVLVKSAGRYVIKTPGTEYNPEII